MQPTVSVCATLKSQARATSMPHPNAFPFMAKKCGLMYFGNTN